MDLSAAGLGFPDNLMGIFGYNRKEECMGKANDSMVKTDKADSKIKDTGNRRVFTSGACRDMSEGKGKCSFLPPNALMALARHFEYGAKKYSDTNCPPNEQNWKRGINISTYIDSAARHLFKALDGREDENHIIAAVWNLVCLYETRVMIDRGELPPELDDLPKRGNISKDYY